MVLIKNIRFDCYLNRFQAQNERQFARVLARQLASACDSDTQVLSDMLLSKVENADLQFVDGVSILDIQSSEIKRPAVFLATLETPLGLREDGQKPFDVVAGVVSDSASGPAHLQKLSKISRLLRSQAFCEEVRSCESVESMEVLFMPEHKIFKAA